MRRSHGSVIRQSSSYLRIFVTTPEPTVRPPSRMAKRTPSSMAIGVINSTLELDVVAGHAHFRLAHQVGRAGHVGRAEVELRTIAAEERRVPAPFLLRQDVDFGLELACAA